MALANSVSDVCASATCTNFPCGTGPIGRVVERLALGSYLERLIEERGAFLKVAAERQHE